MTVDLPAARAYAEAVDQSTDAFLAGLTPDDLRTERDFSAVGWRGNHPLGFVLNHIRADVTAHAGEISCLKGLLGAEGYAF